MNRNIIKGGYATGHCSESAGFKFEAGALFLVPSYTEKLPAAGFKFETKFFSSETVLLRKNADAIGSSYNGDIKQREEERSY